MAAELTTRAMALIAARTGDASPVDSTQVHESPPRFTAGPSFPPLFAAGEPGGARLVVHRPAAGQDGNAWMVDLAPMLNDSSIQQLLSSHNVKVPATLTVPLTVSVPVSSRCGQGQLSRLAAWGPWVSTGRGGPSGFFAPADAVAAARRRGKALTSLGVSALLVGAAGWAGIEAGAPLRQRRAQWHHRQYPPDRRRDGRPRRGQPAPMART